MSTNDDANLATEQLNGNPEWSKGKYAWILRFYYFTQLIMAANLASLNWYIILWKMSLIYSITVNLIVGILSIYCSLFIGYYGDKIVSKYGRRKPVVLIGNLIYYFSVIMLAVPPSVTNQQVLFGWLLLWMCVQTIATSFSQASMSSWYIESTASTEDYNKVFNAILPIPALFGGLAGLGLSFSCTYILKKPIIFAIIATVFASAGLLGAILYLPSQTLRETKVKQPDIIPSLRTCMRSKEFMTIFYNKIVLFSAIGIGASMISNLLYIGFTFIKYYEQLFNLVLTILVVSFIVVVVALRSLDFYMNKFGKLRIYRVYTLVIAGLSLISFIPPLFPSSIGAFYTYVVLNFIILFFSVVLGAIDSFFTRDLVVYDTFVTGLRRENMYQMALNMPTSIAQNIISSIPMFILFGSGFVIGSRSSYEDDQMISRFSWNSEVLWQMRVYGTFLVAALCFISNYLIKDYPLNDSAVERITEVVKAREAADAVQAQEDAESSGISVSTGSSKAVVEGVGPIKDTEDIEFMNHFSRLEVKYLNQGSDVDGPISELRVKMGFGLFLSIGLTVILSVAVKLQFSINQTSFLVMNIAMIEISSLYCLYEVLRLVNLSKLATRSAQDLKSLIKRASEANEAYYDKLKNVLSKSGVLDAAASDPRVEPEESRMSLADKPIDEEQVVLSGYKRIFFALLVMIAYGVISCTLLVYPTIQPPGHAPTYEPTKFMPSYSPTIAPPI